MTAAALTPRQRACASLAAEGLQSKEIARRLGLSQFTVTQYLSQAFRRLEVRNRTQLAVAIVRLGLLNCGGSADDRPAVEATIALGAQSPEATQEPG